MDLKKVGECIRKNREAREISLEELAKLTHIEYTVLQAYESGEKNFTAEDLKKIGEALDIGPLILAHGGGAVHVQTDDGRSIWKNY